MQGLAEREATENQLPPPEPEPMVVPPRFNLAAFRLAALGLALVLAVSLALARLFVGGPPSVADLREQAGVDTWTELPIGVKDDQPGTAFRDPKDGRWSGFDIDIAYMIAEDLGFRRSEVKFYAIESEDRPRMQATDLDGNRVPVKLVVASFSITTKRVQDGVRFSAPYLYTEQSVLTKRGKIPRLLTITDLRGKRVCSIAASTSLEAPSTVKTIIVVPRNKISQCIDDLRAGRVDAITTDATILAGYKDRFEDDFDHWDVGFDPTEAYGVNVGENPALQKLVNLTLYRSYTDPKDSRWEEAYDRNFQSEVDTNKGTPIAEAEQPWVARPDIREQPWEDVFGE